MYVASAASFFSFHVQANQAAAGITTSHDALAELLELIEHFLIHVGISAADDMVVKIMLELFSTLALATRELKQGRPSESVLVHLFPTQRHAVKSVKKCFGDTVIEAILQRLDRLTQDEARMTVPETLAVIYGLVQNMRMLIDGERTHRQTACHPQFVEYSPPSRRQSFRLRCFGIPWYVFFGDNEPDLHLIGALEILHQCAGDTNKPKRQP